MHVAINLNFTFTGLFSQHNYALLKLQAITGAAAMGKMRKMFFVFFKHKSM